MQCVTLEVLRCLQGMYVIVCVNDDYNDGQVEQGQPAANVCAVMIIVKIR